MARPPYQLNNAAIARRGRIHERLMRKFLLRNYLAHMIDGGFYMTGLAFLSAEVVMPEVVKSLNAPELIIASMAIILPLGFQISPIFTAHHIERIKRHHRLLIILGIFQRLPYLITGLLLWFTRHDPPEYIWVLVAGTPLLSALIGGSGISAWLELVANTVPSNRRMSMSSLRQFIGSCAGVGCGVVVALVLKKFPGSGGIGILYLLCFAALTFSMIAFASLKEVPNPRPQVKEKTTLAESISAMPQLLKQAPHVRLYLLEILLSASPMIIMAFLSIHALETLGAEKKFLGTLVSFSMLGKLLANITCAVIGDKFGPKYLLWISKIVLIVACLLVPEANTAWHFCGVYTLLGFALMSKGTTMQIMNTEIVPLTNRVRYLTILMVASLAGTLLVPPVSSFLNKISSGDYRYLAYATLILQLVTLPVLYKLPNTRKEDMNSQLSESMSSS